LVAFLVVSHRNPEQVLRLVRVLREGESTAVVVRHDERGCSLDACAVEAAGGSLLADHHEADWGSNAFADMLLGALEHVRRLHDPDWVVTLSGQDYPLRPVDELSRLLTEGPYQALLHDSWELDLTRRATPPRDEFFRRYAYRHYAVPRSVAGAVSRALGSRAYVRVMPPGQPVLVGLRARRTPFGPGLGCRVSSDWLMLHRTAIESLLGFVGSNPGVMRYYRRAVIPSESLFATALGNDPAIAVGPAPRSLRFQPGAANPDVLGARDVGELLRGGGYLARKFDAEADPRALDLLDEARAGAR